MTDILVNITFTEDEYLHILSELEHLQSDFRYESMTYSRLEYIRLAIEEGRKNFIEAVK